MGQSEKILVIKLGALGDFMQSLGPMQAIRKHHKDAHITLLTTGFFKQFATDCGYFDDILIDERPKKFDVKGWLKLRKILNAGCFTRVYDLQNNDRTGLYFKLLKSPKPEWVGVAKGASHRNVSPDRTAGHAFDGHMQTLALAGVEDVQVDRLDWMVDDVSGFALKKPYVLLVPGCAPDRPEKRWPAAHYGALANMLQSQGYQPIILGTKAEREAADEILSLCPAALDLTDQTSFAHIVTLARNAAGAIGNDTGPMHMIGPTGCPSLVLFSAASNPVKHSPKGANIQTLQRDNLDDLSSEDVWNEMKRALK
ncbi:MAG: glycosyltransferase family 9 protein [Alphaproteobacteria bacterium]